MKYIVYYSKSFCVEADSRSDAEEKASELFEKAINEGLTSGDCLSDVEYADEDEELD